MNKRTRESSSPTLGHKRLAVLKEKPTNTPEVPKKDPPEVGTSDIVSTKSSCEGDAVDKPIVHKEEIDEVEASQDLLPDLSLTELTNATETEFQTLVEKFICSTRDEDLIKTLLQITVICKSQRFIESPLYQMLTTRLLKKIKLYKSKKELMLCQAMFVATLSVENHLDDNKEKFDLLKDFLFSYLIDLNQFSQEYFTKEIVATTSDLPVTFEPLIDFIESNKTRLSVACSDSRKTSFSFSMAAMAVILRLNKNPVDDIAFHFEFCKSLIKRIEFFQGHCEGQSFHLDDPSNTGINAVIVDLLLSIELRLDMLKRVLCDKPLKKLVIKFSDFLLLKKLLWILDYCVNHAFITGSKDFAEELKTIMMSVVELLSIFTCIEYDDDPSQIGELFIKTLLQCVTLSHFTGFEENAKLKICALEVCLLMMQNNWISRERFDILMLNQSVADPDSITANALIKELNFSLGSIKVIDSIDINSPLCEAVRSFLQHDDPFPDVEQLQEMYNDHNFTVAYVSVLLAMFSEGNVDRQRMLRNSISTTDAQACIGILEIMREFIGSGDNTEHPVDVRLFDQSAIIIRSTFTTAVSAV